MNYEKIIVELLGRIQILEEQVAELVLQQEKKKEKVGADVRTEEIREYIKGLKRTAKEQGKRVLVLKAGDIHNALGLKHRHPIVCNAMRDCMGTGDVVLHTTPSGYSSTIEIEYKL